MLGGAETCTLQCGLGTRVRVAGGWKVVAAVIPVAVPGLDSHSTSGTEVHKELRLDIKTVVLGLP